MLPYFVFFSLILVFLVLSKLGYTRFWIFICFIFSGLFSGFRYEVGVDFYSYIDNIDNILHGYSTSFEIGNVFLIRVIGGLNLSYQFFFLFYSILTSIFIFLFVSRYSLSLVTSSFFYFFFSVFYLASFNAVRQYLAISIFLFSIRYILERKILFFFVSILVASMFHLSAILMLPLYFILNLNGSFSRYILFGALGLFSFVFFLEYLAGYIFHLSYLDFENNTTSRGIVVVFIFILVLIFILLRNDLGELVLFKNMLFISMILLILMLIYPKYSMALMRFNSYFLFSLIPVVTFIPSYSRVKLSREFVFIPLVLISTLYFFITILFKGERYKLVPYDFNIGLFYGW